MTQEERAHAIATIFAALWPDLAYRVWHWKNRSEASSIDNFILLVPAGKTVVGPTVRINEKSKIIATWFSQKNNQAGFIEGRTTQEVIDKVKTVGL